jgi:tripartite-type tricarboxylate transporter receptor subunit TctC
MMRFMLGVCLSVLWLALPAASAHAQSAAIARDASADYPRRSVRLLVPFAAGGGTDIIARVVARKVSDAWGQPVVVDNRAGGGGTIAADLAAKSSPDGYTLLLPSISVALAPALYRKLPYDTEKDLAPVILVAVQQNLLVVNPSVPAKSVKELIALAKSKPGEIRVATGGAGASDHIAMELFRTIAGINLVNVPYKGQAPGTTALLGGEVQMQISPMASLMPLVKSGKLRALAVTGGTRASTAPELPTIAEAGLPGYEFRVWYALLAQGATPRPIIRKINEAFDRALAAQDVRERLAEMGIEALGGSTEQFSLFLKNEIKKWTKVIKDAGIQVE